MSQNLQGSVPSYDYIVIGGGSAGCVTAGKLVSRYGAKVLLLESGPKDDNYLIHAPAGFVRMLFDPANKYVTSYSTGPQPTLGGREVSIAQGNVLGGGSSVNAMTYMRGAKSDWDGWDAELGGAGWDWQSMLRYFIEQEGNQRLGAPWHGVSGPLKVSDPHHPPSEISRAFLLALQAEGLRYSGDFNTGDLRGVGWQQSTTYNGRRCSAAKAFIDPLLADPRLTIAYESKALRVLIEGGRAVGVEYAVKGRSDTETAHARSEVVLCAGSLVTPKLLMLSGVGPADMLGRHGIKVVSEVAGVGRNLQDHNDARLLIETNGNFGYSGEDRGWRMLMNGLQYMLYRTGPVSSTGSEGTAFVDPFDYDAPPTVQFYCMGIIYPSPECPNPPAGATFIANLVAPKSRGSVALRSADPADKPIVDLNWLSEPEDVCALVGGLRVLLRATKHAPLREKVARVASPINEASSDEDMADYVRSVTSTNFHPVGSCRMGRDDDPLAVVDARLRVRGIEGLRVFDGSIMPRIIRANTNAAIMGIASRGVDLMMNNEE